VVAADHEGLSKRLGPSREVTIMFVPFELGRLLITPHAQDELDPADVFDGIQRHSTGDWGELDEEDRQENELSLREGFRLISAYIARNGTRFWVITEADRSSTTVLLPPDY
jgi:hypothetical protein